MGFDNLKAKKKGVIRVICLGDSITHGYDADDHGHPKPYPWMLQNKLGKKYEVKNFGVGGKTMQIADKQSYWKENKDGDMLVDLAL